MKLLLCCVLQCEVCETTKYDLVKYAWYFKDYGFMFNYNLSVCCDLVICPCFLVAFL